MRPVAKGLDILQGDKHIFMGYLLPTLVSIEEHLNKKLTEVFYVKPLVNALLKGIHKRFVTCNNYKIIRQRIIYRLANVCFIGFRKLSDDIY